MPSLAFRACSSREGSGGPKRGTAPGTHTGVSELRLPHCDAKRFSTDVFEHVECGEKRDAAAAVPATTAASAPHPRGLKRAAAGTLLFQL